MMPLPYSDVFSVFPEILRAKNRDLKTSHDTYWGCHEHFFFPTTFMETAVYVFTKYGFTVETVAYWFYFLGCYGFLLYISFFYLYVLKHFEYVTYLLICYMVRII